MSLDVRTKKCELSENDIEFIMANTSLKRDQIVKWYDEFTTKCPEKKLDRTSFGHFFGQLLPNSDKDNRFCEAVFKAFDTDRNGSIDFGEFLISFWVRADGSLKDKLSWLFDVYDTDSSGSIAQWELSSMLRSVFAIKTIRDDSYEKSKRIFASADRNLDSRISKQEFIACCTRDETIRELLAPF